MHNISTLKLSFKSTWKCSNHELKLENSNEFILIWLILIMNEKDVFTHWHCVVRIKQKQKSTCLILATVERRFLHSTKCLTISITLPIWPRSKKVRICYLYLPNRWRGKRWINCWRFWVWRDAWLWYESSWEKNAEYRRGNSEYYRSSMQILSWKSFSYFHV